MSQLPLCVPANISDAGSGAGACTNRRLVAIKYHRWCGEQCPLAFRRPRGDSRARREWRGVTGKLTQSNATVTQSLIGTRRARPGGLIRVIAVLAAKV